MLCLPVPDRPRSRPHPGKFLVISSLPLSGPKSNNVVDHASDAVPFSATALTGEMPFSPERPAIGIDDVPCPPPARSGWAAFARRWKRCCRTTGPSGPPCSTGLSGVPASLLDPEERPSRQSCFLRRQAVLARCRACAAHQPPGPGRSLCQWPPSQSAHRASGTELDPGGAVRSFDIPRRPWPSLRPRRTGACPVRIAAFHRLTSGPTVTSNFPAESREYRNASSMTRYKSAWNRFRGWNARNGSDDSRHCRSCSHSSQRQVGRSRQRPDRSHPDICVCESP